jgi:hypothetical protein
MSEVIKEMRGKRPEAIWGSFALNAELSAIRDVALHALPVPASEACVERMFSRQKLALNHLRIRSKTDLLAARFELTE